jgi:hypothetical protein
VAEPNFPQGADIVDQDATEGSAHFPWPVPQTRRDPWIHLERSYPVVISPIEKNLVTVFESQLWNDALLAKSKLAYYFSWSGEMAVAGKPYVSDEVRAVFERNRNQWLTETSTLSSLTDVAMHPAYQEIIGLGPEVLPLIFQDLEQQPAFWFWALAAITRQTPDHEEGNFESARAAWLKWGRDHGYI